MSKTLSGSCQCGAVRYECDAEPILSLICHCRQCQKASGAPSTAFVAVPKAALRVTGEYRLFKSKADSGNDVQRGFCPTCGSRMFGLTSGYPDMISLSVGSLDNASAIRPTAHVFTASAQAWNHDVDALPKFPTTPPM